MHLILKKLLEDTISHDELCCDSYYRTSTVVVISDERDVYEIDKTTNIKFNPAGVAIVRKDNNCLCMFAIHPAYKRQKYGEQLLETILSLYDKLNLYVRISNIAAIALYEKLGFVKERTEVDFYRYTHNNEDAYYMTYSKPT